MKLTVFHLPLNQCIISAMTVGLLMTMQEPKLSNVIYTDVTAENADRILLKQLLNDNRIRPNLYPVLVVSNDEGSIVDYGQNPKDPDDVISLVKHNFS